MVLTPSHQNIHTMKKYAVFTMMALGFMLLLAVFGTFSCKQAAEKQQEKALEKAMEQGGNQNANVDIEKEKITVESDEGKMVIKTGEEKWPSNAPADVPELSAGTIIGTLAGESDQGNSWTIRYQGIEMGELEQYGTRLKNAGFKITKIKSSKGGMVSGEKGNLGVVFTVSPEVSVLVITEMKNNER